VKEIALSGFTTRVLIKWVLLSTPKAQTLAKKRKTGNYFYFNAFFKVSLGFS